MTLRVSHAAPEPRTHRLAYLGYLGAVFVAFGCSGGARPANTSATVLPPTAGARPIPYPVPEPPTFRRAVERGTRTRTGEPGPRYWTQFARYALRAELDPASKRLTGEGRVRYQNRSPGSQLACTAPFDTSGLVL